MKSKLILFILTFCIWVFLRYPPDKQHLLIGLVVAFIVSALCGDLFTTRPKLFLQPKRYLWFAYFIILSAWECFKINIDMALRLVRKEIPLNPGIVKFKTTLKTDTALMFLANTLTLTKGAITVDINKANNQIYIHWIDLKQTDRKKIENGIGQIEKLLTKIFE
ncbi:MAG: Na+/H+ antiporter subunit E [Candidatus Omnitrophica bacterium]|nr:Na+/H+ antiporter subunit E [Candidatus Omnitrophota bacterium]